MDIVLARVLEEPNMSIGLISQQVKRTRKWHILQNNFPLKTNEVKISN